MIYQWDQRTDTITDYIFLGKTLVTEAQVSLGNGAQSVDNTNVGYTGHQWDNDSGLNYMQARYYDPLIGRFMSNDPVGFRDIHSFNRYAYANNNPYKYVDPNGELAFLAWFATPPGIAALQYTGIALLGIIGGVAIVEGVNESANNDSDEWEEYDDDWESANEEWLNNNSDSTTKHGKERENRGVDKDKTREKGEKFTDTETGATVYVDGNNVVIDGTGGNVTSWSDQTDAETSGKVEDNIWAPID